MMHAVIGGSAVASAAIAALWPRVAYRLAVTPATPARDACGACGHPFPAGWHGWLALGRVCRTHTVTPWWVASGLACAAGAVLAWRLSAADPSSAMLLLAWLVFVQVGTLLSMIDIAVHRLPTPVIAAMTMIISPLIVTSALLAHQPTRILTVLAAAAVLGGGYLLLALLAPTQIGMGDVRLAAMTGAMLGAHGWTTVTLGAVLPYLVALPSTIAQLRRTAPASRRQVPFGPFLIAGAVIAATIAP